MQEVRPTSTLPPSPDGSLVLAQPGATATRTPFLPLSPTATYLPTAYPTPTLAPSPTPTDTPLPEFIEGQSKSWSDYPGPIIWPDINIPPPMGILPQPRGQVNILLLGSDQRPYTGGFRTDTILLLTVNPAQGNINLTSFPRDLYVYIPGWTVHRINTAFGQGDFEALATTMEYNFGVRPDYYFLINFWSFKEVIDSLGGIDVKIGKDFCDHRDDWGTFCVSQGPVYHMDGETALWYVRARYSTSDFDRGRRQQEVILAGIEKLISIHAISKAAELYEIYRDSVTTNMEFDDMLRMLPMAGSFSNLENIHHYYIGREQVTPWVNYNGAQVLLPIREAVLEIMQQVLNSSN